MLNNEKLIGKQTSCIKSLIEIVFNVHEIIFRNNINYFLSNNKDINHITLFFIFRYKTIICLNKTIEKSFWETIRLYKNKKRYF